MARFRFLLIPNTKKMIRLSGKAYAVAENEQRKWMDTFLKNSRTLRMYIRGIHEKSELFSVLIRRKWSILILA